MAEPSKVTASVCAGVDLEVLKGIKWNDKNHDGIPQMGELKDGYRTVISDQTLIARIAAAQQCYTELQALFGGVKEKPSAREKLAAAQKTIKKAFEIAEDLRPDNYLSIRARLLHILGDPEARPPKKASGKEDRTCDAHDRTLRKIRDTLRGTKYMIDQHVAEAMDLLDAAVNYGKYE